MTLYLGPYATALADHTWDALICDPPYSEKTHSGHNDGAATADRMRDQLARMEVRIAAGLPISNRSGARKKTDAERLTIMRADVKRAEKANAKNRRAIEYGPWSAEDVRAFVEWAHPRTRGWMVCMCDDMLAPAYIAAMEAQGRYVFAPIVWFAPGSRVRMTGDGPACWAVWIIVSRPKHAPYTTWGSLPGGYHFTARGGGYTGDGGAHENYIGGKPLALMRALVRDYSRPGNVVCDPCAGWGTTLLAARELGRNWIGSEIDATAHGVASERLRRPYTPQLFDDTAPARQAGLFEGAEE